MKDLGVKLLVLVESLLWDSPPVGPTDEFSAQLLWGLSGSKYVGSSLQYSVECNPV